MGKAKAKSSIRKRVSDIIEVGYNEDFIGRAYDVLNFSVIVINLTVGVMMTFQEAMDSCGDVLLTIEAVTVAFFAFDLLLRIWTAGCLWPELSEPAALLKYIFSFTGIVDILSCLPYYLPFFFPSGVAAFRIFRVMRIFRIFRVNAYFDSLNVIAAVIKNKARLLLSSVFIIIMLMLASSLCMYSLEHSLQPNVYDNALSGLWWSAAALLTVGYGDIYPISVAGKIVGMVLTMLGVGLVAIPTGIISAGFVEQYEKLRRMTEQAAETDVHFIRVKLEKGDNGVGAKIAALKLPRSFFVAAIERKGQVLVPRGEEELMEGDVLVFCVAGQEEGPNVNLKELVLKEQHEWCGQKIRDLDISRLTFIVMVRRRGRSLIPNGDLRLQKGDVVMLYNRLASPKEEAHSGSGKREKR